MSADTMSTTEIIDAKLQAFEDRQNEKLAQILGYLAKGGGSGGDHNDLANTQKELEKKVENLSVKIDTLLSGENESNKILDDLGPAMDRIDKTYDLLKDIDESDEKFRKFFTDRLKSVMDEVLSTKSHVKDVERETSYIYKDLKVLRDRSGSKSRDSAKRSSRRNDHSSRKRRRRSSGSDRSRSSSSSIRSKSRDTRQNSAARPLPGTVSKKELGDLEKLIVQLNDSIGVLSDRVEKMSQTIMNRVTRGGSELPPAPMASMWDDDASPSPLRKQTPGTPTSHVESFLKEDKSSKKNKKKKRRRTASSSSDGGNSSDEDKHSKNNSKIETKNSSTNSKLIDNRFSELNKTLKKSLYKVDESHKTVLKRVDAMASGIQLIAENMDSINDLRKDLEDVPKEITTNALKIKDQIEMVLSYVDGTKGRKVSSDEYGQISNFLQELDGKNSKSFCEFGSLVEGLQGSALRRLDKIEHIINDNQKNDRSYIAKLLDISEQLIGCMINVDDTQKNKILPAITKILEEPLKIVNHNENKNDVIPQVSNDTRIVPLGAHKELHWDELYTKIIPSLENLTAKINKLEHKEVGLESGGENVQIILGMLQDIKDDRLAGAGSEAAGSDVQRGSGSGGSENRELLKRLDALQNGLESIREETRGLKLLENVAKCTDELKKNSRSDAQTFSTFNTTLQSMKASMTGINTGTAAIKDVLVGLEKKISDLESSNVGVETKLQTEIISGIYSFDQISLGSSGALTGFGVVQEGLKPCLERLAVQNSGGAGSDSKVLAPQLSKILDNVEKLISKVSKLESHQHALERQNSENKNGSDTSNKTNTVASNSEVNALTEKLRTELATMGSEIKTQLDDIHDMIYNLDEKTTSAVDNVKNTVASNDKRTHDMITKVGAIIKAIHDNNGKGNNNALEEQVKSVQNNLVDIKESIELIQGGGPNAAGKPKQGNKTANVNSIEQLNNKLEKMSKIINRVKFLVEEKEIDEKESTKVQEKIKVETTDFVSSDISNQLSKFQNSVEEELSNQSEMMADLTNHFQELADKVSTKEAMKAFFEDIKFRLSDIGNGLSDMKGLGGGGGGTGSSQFNTRELEDNLAAAVSAALRDENQKSFDTVTDNLFDIEAKLREIENKLHGIKRLVSTSGRRGDDGASGSESANSSRLLDRVEVVARRLESVQTAVENCGNGAVGVGAGDNDPSFHVQLLLEEIRKRAESESLDRLSQDLFKSIHNVQQRLLEEHKRLMNKLCTLQETCVNPSTNLLLETLNKVRVAQQNLLNKKGSCREMQEETNKLLKSIVDILENTHSALHGENPAQMTRRMAELCDELSTALNNLIMTQKTMSDMDGLVEIDSLLRVATSQLRHDSLLSGPGDTYHRSGRNMSGSRLLSRDSPVSRDSDDIGRDVEEGSVDMSNDHQQPGGHK